MSTDTTERAPLTAEAPVTEGAAPVERDATPAGADAVEELLVEEISIDGMCGVY